MSVMVTPQPFPVTVNGGRVRNEGSSTIYYRDETPVTSATNDGSIVAGASMLLEGTQYLATAAGARSYVNVTPGLPASGFFSTVITPSTDTTGVSDRVAINAALVAGDVWLTGNYYIDASIVIPSNRAFVLADASVTLVAGSNSNIIKNSNLNVTGNTNIQVRGIGRAELIGGVGATFASASTPAPQSTIPLTANLPAGTYRVDLEDNTRVEDLIIVNGNSTNATSSPYTATLLNPTTKVHSAGATCHNQMRSSGVYNNVGVFFVNVTGFTVQDIKISCTNAFAGLQQACTTGRWINIELNQDSSSINQDGIDVGPGCSDISITGLRGSTGDDMCSIYAQNTSTTIHPYVSGLTNAQRNVTNIRVSACEVDIAINPFRLQAGDGSTLTNLRFSGIRNLRTSSSNYPVLQFGSTNYVSTPPAAADMANIVLDGFVGPGKWLVGCDSNFSDVQVRNVKMTGTWTAIVGRVGTVAGFVMASTELLVENVNTTGTGGQVCKINKATATLAGLTIRNVHCKTCSGVLANDATITNLEVSDVKVTTMTGVAVQSSVAEVGQISNVKVDAYSGAGATNHYTGAACALKMTGEMPQFLTGDTAPAKTRGSKIFTAASYDPGGGSVATQAEYVGDGTAWNRTVTMAN